MTALAGEEFIDLGRGATGEITTYFFRLSSQLPKDVIGAHRRILNVRPRLAVEAQRLFEIEGDDRGARVLEQEVAQGRDRNLVCDASLLGLADLGMTRLDLGQGRSLEPINQVVSLHPQPFAPRHSDLL